MISITQLKTYMAAYPETPPRTTALEQRIQIGTGFHNKWYRSQKEHMLGWTVVQEGQARRKGLDPSTVDARGMWNRLKCSPLMFWLAECAGVAGSVLDQAEETASAAARINPNDGNPHGRMMREVLPWDVVARAILSGPPAVSQSEGAAAARRAFDRLANKRATYRKFEEWIA